MPTQLNTAATQHHSSVSSWLGRQSHSSGTLNSLAAGLDCQLLLCASSLKQPLGNLLQAGSIDFCRKPWHHWYQPSLQQVSGRSTTRMWSSSDPPKQDFLSSRLTKMPLTLVLPVERKLVHARADPCFRCQIDFHHLFFPITPSETRTVLLVQRSQVQVSPSLPQAVDPSLQIPSSTSPTPTLQTQQHQWLKRRPGPLSPRPLGSSWYARCWINIVVIADGIISG